MKKSYKAALFSALIFPGSGHILLKQYPLAFLFAGTATVCICALVFRAIAIAQTISDQLLSGEIPLDIARISSEISIQSDTAGSTTVTIATWVLIFCWIGGTADAFRLGRQRDRAEQTDGQSSQSPVMNKIESMRLSERDAAGSDKP
jgi:hypothetical protein